MGGGDRLLCPSQEPSYHANRLASNPYWRHMSALALTSEKERPSYSSPSPYLLICVTTYQLISNTKTETNQTARINYNRK